MSELWNWWLDFTDANQRVITFSFTSCHNVHVIENVFVFALFFHWKMIETVWSIIIAHERTSKNLLQKQKHF